MARDDRDERFMSGPGLIITRKDGTREQLPLGPRKYTDDKGRPLKR